MHSVGYLLLCSILGALSSAQSLDASLCVDASATVSNCNFYNSKLNACNSLRGSAAASCYCPQTVFDALVRCEGEFRICYATDYFDPQFEAPSSGLFALWHSACDATLTYTVTTPAAAGPSITVEEDYCNSVYNACNQFGALTDSCTMSYTADSAILGCWCQSSIISLASRCQIDGSSSCFLESVVTSSLWSYKFCKNGLSAGAQPAVTVPTATVAPSTTTDGTGQGGSIPAGTAAPSTLPSIPGLSTSTLASVTSWSATVVRPSLWNIISTAVCTMAIVFLVV